VFEKIEANWLFVDIFLLESFPFLIEGSIVRTDAGLPVGNEQTVAVVIPPGKHKFKFNIFSPILVNFEIWKKDNFRGFSERKNQKTFLRTLVVQKKKWKFLINYLKMK